MATLAICCLVIAGAGCKKKEKADTASDLTPMPSDTSTGDEVVVEVDGVKLTETELNKRMARVLASPRMKSVPPAEQAQAKKDLRDDVTEAFISQTVLLHEAERLNITVGPRSYR
jgi:hypothetical protein